MQSLDRSRARGAQERLSELAQQRMTRQQRGDFAIDVSHAQKIIFVHVHDVHELVVLACSVTFQFLQE